MAAVREAVLGGELGEVYAVDLTFHNAYGPDKPWFYDVKLAGGGCVMDLGSHLVDLALWILDFPQIKNVASALYAQGKRLPKPVEQVEDYAMAHLELNDGASIRLACSWGLAAGQDAVIEAVFYGTRGGAALRNVNGSFYDFTVERFYGTRRELLATFPDLWGGRALVDWARRLAADGRFDAKTQQLVDIAATLDRIYGR
jgi:predicted dehydrogenase